MKTLVVYYSLEGNTRAVAELIAETQSADLFEIKLKKPYHIATAVALSKLHIDNKTIVELNDFDFDFSAYDRIYLGTPVWWFTFTPPLRAFLNKVSFAGKDVHLFCTHGGDPGKTFPKLSELLVGANIKSSRDFYTVRKVYKKADKWALTKSEVQDWLN